MLRYDSCQYSGKLTTDINLSFVRDRIASFQVPKKGGGHIAIDPCLIFHDDDTNVNHLQEAIDGSNRINIIDILGIFKRANLKAFIFTNCLPLPLARIQIREGINIEPIRIAMTANNRS
jgi:hypothetical protein